MSKKHEIIPSHVSFYFVDVFAEEPLTGNPLSIVPYAQALDELTMKRIASELNQAETTFLSPSTKADWRLRSFTASGHEVYGAGHNSLGAWWWLADSGRLKLKDGVNRFTQEIGDAILPVEVLCEEGRAVSVDLVQGLPVLGNILEDVKELAVALGIEENDIERERLPVQVVSTGAPHLLVPVKGRQIMGRLQPASERLTRVLASIGGEGCYVFSLDPISPLSIAHARFFNPTVGLAEDAATGTAAGPLAYQLVLHGIAIHDRAVMIEQGFEMGRPSSLRLKVNEEIVKLSGKGIVVIEGRIRLK